MGLFQKAVETYDAHANLIGVEREGGQPLAPLYHSVTQADIEITLEADGSFSNARAVDKSEPKTIIPVTEESAGRSGIKPPAHPLCDNLVYLATYNQERHQDYLEQLTAWADFSHSPMLGSILTYVRGGTILADLERCDLVKLDDKGLPQEEKLFVRWKVLGLGNCWQQPDLWTAFQDWMTSLQSGADTLCMVSGVKDTLAKQHPKTVVPLHGNAKLISSNDTKNFTFLGRFTDESQSLTVGSVASQKAHNALRWLVMEQGQYTVGKRVFLCWNPQGHKIRHAIGPFAANSQEETVPSAYMEALGITLKGYLTQLPSNASGVVIAAFDAASKGRLAVTYYNELEGSDFLQRLHEWDLHCAWYDWKNWWHRKEQIQSPPMWQIVNFAFGSPVTEKGKVRLKADDKLLGQQLQRLLACRIDRARMPTDIMRALVHRASAPQALEPSLWRAVVSTACAVIRKYRYDYFKEDDDMEFVPNKRDRSYQFGCLLAILEKVERDTYGTDEKREPNAIRLMSMYCRRPMTTFHTIHNQLNQAYFPRLEKPSWRTYYRNRIGEILEIIQAVSTEKDLNAPLKEDYLMGYYLQRKALYTKHTNQTEPNKNEEDSRI